MGSKKKPAIFLLGGIGTPAILFEPLAKLLRKNFFLITWDYRGLLDSDHTPVSLDEHMADILRIAAHFGIEQFNALSFCSGGKILLKFNALYPQYLLKQVLVNANITNEFVSEEQQKLVELLTYTVKNPDNIVQVYNFIHQTVDQEKIGKCPLQTQLALPYQSGPDFFLCFAKSSLVIVDTQVELDHLNSQADSIYLVIDQNSQLADKRDTLNVLMDYTENPIISMTDSGHYSLYDSQSVQQSVADIFSTNDSNTPE